jgi:hypothetical protein
MTESRRSRHGDPVSCALVTLAFGVMAGMANAACPPEDSDGTVIRKGDLVLAYRPLLTSAPGPKARRIPMAKHFTLEVQLCNKGDVSGAQLQKADASMPAHKHGMNYRPTITPLGGQWELAFEVLSGQELTRLTDDIQAD